MTRHERGMAATKALGARARLLAASGVERTRHELARGDPAPYGGENWDGDTPPVQAAGPETDEQSYRPAAFDVEGCPAAYALRPSWFSAHDGLTASGARAPDLTRVGGTRRGFSGRLRGTQGDRPGLRGDVYVLRAIPGEGIHLNDGDPALPAVEAPNARLGRILETLADAVDREDGVADGAPVGAADGRALVDARPPRGWQNWDQVRDGALGGDEGKLRALAPYATLRAWSDRHALAPNADASVVSQAYSCWADWRTARLPTAAGGVTPDRERAGGRPVGRSPVNLAWARTRRPVLIALISGLEGVYLDETACTTWADKDRIGAARRVRVALDWAQPTDDCRLAADAILAHAGPLENWMQVEALLDGIPFSTDNDWGAAGLDRLADIVRAKRDLLKANFDPNLCPNDFNPDPSRWRLLDKGDLFEFSTEFSLFPAGGPQVASLGRVVDPAGEILAEAEVETAFAPPQAVRLTTQAEFCCQDLGDPSAPGDESGVRLPGDVGPGGVPFLSESVGDNRTWGHRLDLSAASPGTWMDGDSGGTGVQTYPAPCHDPDGPGPLPPALVPAPTDGWLALATVETLRDEMYGAPGAPDMTMLARFDDHPDLDVADGADSRNQQDALQPGPGAPLWDSAGPGTLFPDGAYSERERTLAYLTTKNTPDGAFPEDWGNLHGFRATVSFWMKPNYLRRADVPPRAHTLVETVGYDSKRFADDPMNQFLWVGDAMKSLLEYGMHFEIAHSSDDTDMEHSFWTPPAASVGRGWRLVTAAWDFRSPSADGCGVVAIDRGTGAIERTGANTYSAGNVPALAEDITRIAANGDEQWIVLGRRGYFGTSVDANIDLYYGGGPDATYDEVAAWDLGPAEAIGLAAARYPEGRYYRGAAHRAPAAPPGSVPDEAGSWVSPPIALPDGARLRRIVWTHRRPSALPDDYAEIELLTPAGTAYLEDEPSSRSTLAPGWGPDRSVWAIVGSPAGPLRVRVALRRVTPVDDNTPILDSPTLDDLTLLYAPRGGPAIVSWREAR